MVCQLLEADSFLSLKVECISDGFGVIAIKPMAKLFMGASDRLGFRLFLDRSVELNRFLFGGDLSCAIFIYVLPSFAR